MCRRARLFVFRIMAPLVALKQIHWTKPTQQFVWLGWQCIEIIALVYVHRFLMTPYVYLICTCCQMLVHLDIKVLFRIQAKTMNLEETDCSQLCWSCLVLGVVYLKFICILCLISIYLHILDDSPFLVAGSVGQCQTSGVKWHPWPRLAAVTTL